MALKWQYQQRAKKVVSNSPGLVDFAIRLVNSVLKVSAPANSAHFR